MRGYVAFVLVFSLGVAAASRAARKPENPDSARPYYSSLTDPACPVTGFREPIPYNKEMRVLYYPEALRATIPNPKSLVLHMVLDNGYFAGDERTAPFVRRDDGVWLAVISLEQGLPRYATYWVEDHEGKQKDTNAGRYFEVRFCRPTGERQEESVQFEAQSYTGILTAHGIDRPVDFRKAMDVLEEYIHAPSRGGMLIGDLWRDELHYGGNTPEARSALVTKMNRFIAEHTKDGFGLDSALVFVASEEWIPAETSESLLVALETGKQDSAPSPRAFFLLARAGLEKDKAKQGALRRELIEEYPESEEAYEGRLALFNTGNLEEKEKFFEALVKKHPGVVTIPIQMARAYEEANQKLPQALVLLDRAEKILAEQSMPIEGEIVYGPDAIRSHRGMIAIIRAKTYMEMGEPAKAVATLLPRKAEFKLPSSFYLLGQALEATGNYRGAVDCYLEAAVRPWSDQKEAGTALERLWVRGKMGGKKELAARMEAISQGPGGEYVPRLLQHPAPRLDLVTLRGERFSNETMKGKVAVVNFWATWCAWCLMELKPLQDFQDRHPEVVVLAVVEDKTETKDLESVIRGKKLKTLRISEAPFELWQQFGAFGVPNTFVVDKAGNVRTQHYGDMPDVERYLTADLRAIAGNEN